MLAIFLLCFQHLHADLGRAFAQIVEKEKQAIFFIYLLFYQTMSENRKSYLSCFAKKKQKNVAAY